MGSHKLTPRIVGFVLGVLLTCGYAPRVFADGGVVQWSAAWIGIGALLWFCADKIDFPKPGLAFLCLAWLSLFWAPIKFDAAWEMAHWILLAGCFVVGASGLARPIFEGAAWGMAVNSMLAIAQMFGWTGVEQFETPAGFFGNRDLMAEAALITIVPLVAQRRWRMAVLLLPALILPQSRAALLAGGATMVICARPRWRWAALAALVVAGLIITFFKHIHSDQVRLELWRETWDGVNWLGHGAGQFYSQVLAYHDPASSWRAEHAHNDWLELLFEFGPAGAALAAWFALQLVGGNVAPLEWRAAWTAFAALCFVSFSLHNWATAVLGFLAAGGVHRTRRLVRHRDMRATDSYPTGAGGSGLGGDQASDLDVAVRSACPACADRVDALHGAHQ